MKRILKKIIPLCLRNVLRNKFNRICGFFRGLRPPEKVFTDIYQNNAWGGKTGEFNSGSGTSDANVTAAYVSAVRDYLGKHSLTGLRYVDLGCGDFRVGRQLVDLSASYVGVDVVRPLVEDLNAKFATETLAFRQLDLIKDRLPEGDICFIRQVMQHMSNGQIAKLLPKLSAYRCVFITEHHPKDKDLSAPNLDKPCGSTIRLERSSGVYLDQPPFSVPSSHLECILEVPGVTNEGPDQGLMRTFVYRP